MNYLTILIGLPGSGKTTYAKVLKNDRYIDGDAIYKNGGTIDDVIAKCKESSESTVVDGLFLTKEIQDKFMELNYYFYIHYVYFEVDRVACLYNDSLRTERSFNSVAIIKEAQVHTQGYKMETIKYDYIGQLQSQLGMTYKEIRSETWCTGGTYGTCWDEDGPSPCSVESPISLNEFYEYTTILKHFYGDNYLHFIDKFQDRIDVEEDGESDYYGGYQHLAYYTFKPRNLISTILSDMYGITKFDLDYIHEHYPEILI